MRGKQYIMTERAHLMCPNMHFGIKSRIKANYDFIKIESTMKLLMNAHPFLRSLIAIEKITEKLYYELYDEIQIPIIEKERADLWSKDYQELTSNGWDVFSESLLKVIVYPLKEDFEVLFIAHHLLGDGRAIIGLVCEFADNYAIDKKPVYVNEQLIYSIHDFPKGSDLSFINRFIINSANRKWVKENHTVSYSEYRDFERQFMLENSTSYSEETVEIETVKELLALCRKNKISLNDYIVAEMMCREKIDKIVIGVDIRKHLNCYQQGALGNYATAMAIVSNSKSDNVIERAKDVSKQIKYHLNDNHKMMMVLSCYLRMSPKLIDAIAISTMGSFQSKAGKFVGALIFGYKKRNGYSVTNLGNINNLNIVEAMFIPPASPANRKTMGVLSVNGLMKKCTASYEIE
nr:hypothetical protein NZ312_09780 [Clostridioides difficile]